MAYKRQLAKGLIFALFLGVAACGGSEKDPSPDDSSVLQDGEIVPRDRRAVRAAENRERRRQQAIEDTESRFSYFRYRIDVSEADPKACFVFSDPLDPETDYSPFVEFRPAFRPALSVEGRELCVGGLSFGEDRIAVLKSGLPAAEPGRILAASEDVSISFEDRPAYVGFKGAGVILPRENADGLPIETVNIDKVRITVSRVNDRALVNKSIDQGETAAQGRGTYLWGSRDAYDVSTELWSGTMDVTRSQNTPVVSVFPLNEIIGDLDSGAYFVRLEDARDLDDGSGPPASAVRWIMVTDLALTAYRGEHGIDVTLRSLQNGNAMPGLTVQLLARNNDILSEQLTDSNGRVRFDKPVTAGNGNDRPHMIMAFGADNDLALLDLSRAAVDISSENISGRSVSSDIDGFIYTERGIYRPGETVHLTTLLRSTTGFAIDDRPGTIIVRRPNGLEADRFRFETASGGGLEYNYTLSKSSARGTWTASAQIDGIGAVGNTSFSVEDFVPQRIKVTLEGDSETPIKKGGTQDITAEARFLYGAPGAGLTVQATSRVQLEPTPFAGSFDGFRFGEYDSVFREQIIELDDQTADGAGIATLRLQPEARIGSNAGRPLRLKTVVDVLEPGGRAVSESISVPYRPQELYLGIKDNSPASDQGETKSFDLVAVNDDGAATSATINWKVISINYHYDWYRDGSSWRWRRSRSVATVNEGVARTSEGASTQINVEGLDYGTHEVLISTESEKASLRFNVGWGGSISSDGVEAPDRVEVFAPEDPAQVGRDAQISIVSPFDGIAEITVATDRVLSVISRPVSTEGNRITLPTTAEWGEGAYVMVTVYSVRNPVLEAKPRRALGVTYVPVDMSARTIGLTINAPEIARPRQTRRITVDLDTRLREPVYVTLAAVDEGILQLTKFKSPDAVKHFFGKKRLGVSLYDDYGRLLDPNLGLPSEVRTGGDQIGGEGLSVVPTKSVALYSGIVETGRSGRADIELELPDFNGELRLMAIAWSKSGVGSASQPMIVRDTVPSDLILPRFLAPGDEAFATVSIDNVEGDAGTYQANLASEGGVEAAGSQVARTLQEGQRADERIRLTASTEGISDLRLDVEGPDSFNVTHEYPIQTRSAFLPVARVSRVLMQPGGAYSIDNNLFNGLQDGSHSMTVSFSSLPVDAGALYASLSRYPHGCTEQTVSRVMPLLYSEQLVDLGSEEARDDGAPTRIQASINTLLNRQSADGAFGLWRESDRYASPWLGAYTTDFLYRAREAGYVVPNEALERAYSALQTITQGDAWRVYGYQTDVYESDWHNDTTDLLMQRASAYALYVLAKAGKADIARLRYLHDRELDKVASPLARAHIGAALAHLGDRSRADSAFKTALLALDYENDGDYYQTPRRDLAGIVALIAETGFADLLTDLSEKLAADLPDPNRLTTQEKAFLLLAVDALVGEEGGVEIETAGLGQGFDNEERYYLSESQLAGDVRFTLKGDKPLFRTVIAYGKPNAPPPPISEKVTITKRVHTLTGARANLSNIKQGDQFVVILTINPEEKRTNPLIVSDLLPAGFEIETILRPADGTQSDRQGAFAWVGKIAAAQTAEARDDRFLAAIDVGAKPVTLSYMVRAVTPGEFVIPGANVEDMYRPDVFARSRAGRVTINALTTTAKGTP